MTRDRMAGSWKQLSGAMRECWGRLMADRVAIQRGQRDRLLGRIQMRHGVALDAPHRAAHAAAHCGSRA
jgi:uncharacterized protein YjbJ (UPF0337 family)